QAGRVSAVKHVLRPLRSYYRRHPDYRNPTLHLGEYPTSHKKKKPVVFTPEESRKILAALDPRYTVFVMLSLWTGARFNEVAALYVSDIDWARGVITISYGLSRTRRGYVRMAPKTDESIREVKMSPELVKALRRHVE